jgi:hypothetical protein
MARKLAEIEYHLSRTRRTVDRMDRVEVHRPALTLIQGGNQEGEDNA